MCCNSTFTDACIAHVEANDRDRMHRKVFKLLQLAILPAGEEGVSSPYRAVKRVSSFDLTDPPLSSSDAIPRGGSGGLSSVSYSGPKVNTRPSSSLLRTSTAFDAIGFAGGAASGKLKELEEEEILDEEMIDKPPPIKDLDSIGQTRPGKSSSSTKAGKMIMQRNTFQRNNAMAAGMLVDDFDF